MSFKKILMLGCAVAVMTSGAIVQQAKAAQDDLTINAQIIATLTIDCTAQALDFGIIDPGPGSGIGGTGGTVVISTAGAASATGDVTAVTGGAEGQCSIGGENGYPYDLTFAGGVTVDDAGAGAPMAVDTWVVSFDGAPDDTTSPYSATMAGGTDIASIGATLHVDADQLAGNYTGTVAVTAVYQ